MNDALFVVPHGIDDPARPSGGNHYDRRIVDGLTHHGWSVRVLPTAGAAGAPSLQRALTRQPDGAVVIVDGLVAAALADVLVEQHHRLRLVLLMHMPQNCPDEHRVAASATVVATSEWTRQWLVRAYRIPSDRLRVVTPGVEPAEMAPPSPAGGRLLCVAALRSHKGQDVLIRALSRVSRGWQCTFVGARDLEAEFSRRVEDLRDQAGLTTRVRFAGPLVGAALDWVYRQSDLLVVPSLHETYGMVVTEALARGLPVVASDTGGIRESLGAEVPGLLVPPGDAVALAAALQSWLGDAVLRKRLRAAARQRRATLTDWRATAGEMAQILTEVAA